MTTPFKQKIMAAAELIEQRAQWPLDTWSDDKLLGLTKFGYYVEGRKYENDHLFPLLTRLVDEVEVLKAALEKIHDTDFAASVHMPIIAEEALETHQKRREDLK